MQLTKVQCLPNDYTRGDVVGLVRVVNSTVASTLLTNALVAQVKPDDVSAWLLAKYTHGLAQEFLCPRISLANKDNAGWTVSRAEHLVIRDLDIEHESLVERHTETGCIVGHADYRYHPGYDLKKDESNNQDNVVHQPIAYPTGYNVELLEVFEDTLIATIEKLFHGLPCFTLRGISTLTPSHLRRGIAKKLTEWVFTYADHTQLPVILVASPLGVPLYQKCGFEAYRKYDIIIDMSLWGAEGIHKHVVMVRWPEESERLPSRWVEWRQREKAS